MKMDVVAKPDTAWSDLLSDNERCRSVMMIERFLELVELSEEEQAATVAAMIQAEYRLDTPSLRAMTLSRLRAWIAIAVDSPQHAELCARIYDAAFARLPGELAWRRVEVMQSVLREGLSLAEISALANFIPAVGQISVARIPGLVRAEQEIVKPQKTFAGRLLHRG